MNGILYIFELARRLYSNIEDINIKDFASPIMILGDSTSISTAIDQFQAEEQEMALILTKVEI